MLLAFLLVSSLAFSQAKLRVSDAKKSFGTVKKGEVVKSMFEIGNTGNAPLLITGAEVSCSCTTVDYPKQPILPGQTATITVSFDTKSAYGRQDREVFLISNDPAGPAKLRFKGIVLK